MIDRSPLESAALHYSHLRGLIAVPLGLLAILAALGNWAWGPLADPAVFVGCVLVLGAASFAIARHYDATYGRVTTSDADYARGILAAFAGAAIVFGGSLLLRSRASWSLDLPVNPTIAACALFMLAYHAITTGIRRHQLLLWGATLVAGLLPVWGLVGLSTASNVGLVVVGVVAILAGLLDHALLTRTLGAPIEPRNAC